jgi:hypothetical protein
MMLRYEVFAAGVFLVAIMSNVGVAIIPLKEPVVLLAEKRVYRLRLGDNCPVAIDLVNLSDEMILYAECRSNRAKRVAKLWLTLYRDGKAIEPFWRLTQPAVKTSTPLLELKPGERVRSWFDPALIYNGNLRPGTYEIRVSYRMRANPATGITQLEIPERTVAMLVVKDRT